ncbi:PREDICTED: protein asteroid homolog 1-like [Amphimedon queenslandica]|nr:PREDICTED: protein asteroid homolog 1-like [Amphimedon queenslandica]|eukprot:XP_019852353.1 PREDICTED: protein asteroid homolog 1-like [Amphimedon queenslandica]
MGIRGITTYMKQYYLKRRESIEVRGQLILDAMSICFAIHRNNHTDWLHGGQYWELRQSYKRFITSLLESGIEPIVIFDGLDYTRKKSGVMMERKKSARQTISNFLDKPSSAVTGKAGLPHGSKSNDVIPLFSEAVFCETLRELGVCFIYADGDADSTIASFANNYFCSVVSNDSDFFFFNIRAGYIPFNNLHWKEQPVTAQVYYLEDFVHSFNFKCLEAPLLIPAILGNDYIKPLKSPCLRGDIAVNLLKYRERRGGSRSRLDKIHELVMYLRKFSSLDKFLNRVSRCCLHNEVSIIEKKLEIAKEFYTVKAFSIDDIMDKAKMTTSNGTTLPLWVIQQYRKGQFSR